MFLLTLLCQSITVFCVPAVEETGLGGQHEGRQPLHTRERDRSGDLIESCPMTNYKKAMIVHPAGTVRIWDLHNYVIEHDLQISGLWHENTVREAVGNETALNMNKYAIERVRNVPGQPPNSESLSLKTSQRQLATVPIISDLELSQTTSLVLPNTYQKTARRDANQFYNVPH